jgi:hypothetical protein
MSRFSGLCLALAVVSAYCGVAFGVTVDSIMINTHCAWMNKVPQSSPYSLNIDIMSSDPSVKGVRIYTPSGSGITALDLSAYHNDWEYSSPDTYATFSALQLQYKPGTWTVQFLGDGSALLDTASLSYDPALPAGVPTVTSPAANAGGVSLTPTFAWSADSCTGDALSMNVRPVNGDDQYQLLADLSATQWTPGLLNSSTSYELEIGNYTAPGVSIVDGHPQGAILTTAGGASFMYLPVCGNVDTVNFSTVPEPGALLLLALGGITLLCRRFYVAK